MTMRHIFAEAYISNDEERGQFLFQEANGLLDDAVGGVSARCFRILGVGNPE